MSQRNYPAFSYHLRDDKAIVIGLDWSWTSVYYADGTDGDPFDWTDWSAVAKVRAKMTDEAELLTLGVALGTDGSVALAAVAADTGELTAHDAAVWDIVTTDPDGNTERFAAGTVQIVQAASR